MFRPLRLVQTVLIFVIAVDFFVKSIKVVDFFVVDIFVTQPVLVLVFFRSAKIARFSSYSSRGAAKMSDPGQMCKYRNRVTICT